jgi:hypothetical protein
VVIALEEQATLLRSIMRRVAPKKAVRTEYRGEGDRWGYARDEELRRVIAAGEHVAVLRSEGFCRVFWTPRLTALPYVVGAMVGARWPEDADTRWQRHHAAIQNAEDPLAYCVEFMDRSAP